MPSTPATVPSLQQVSDNLAHAAERHGWGLAAMASSEVSQRQTD